MQRNTNTRKHTKYKYPPDDELVGLFWLYGYTAAVGREINVNPKALGGYIDRRPNLKERLDAVRWDDGKPVTTRGLPTDVELLALVEKHGNIAAAARYLGVERSTLHLHVNRYPQLKASIKNAMRETGYYSKERQKERFDNTLATWRRKNRDRLCEGHSRRRSRQKFASPEEREDTISFMEVLRNDPCSYCGLPMDHVDHIVPLDSGGEHHWTNMTAACANCNLRKHTKGLLHFLLV